MIAHIKTQVSDSLSPVAKQLIKDAHVTTKKSCTGDGAGLNHGNSSEKIMTCFLSRLMPETFQKFNSDESDFKICDTPLSYKHISGRSTIALDWSKNELQSQRKYFQCDIMIYVEKTQQWWKSGPKISFNDIDYTQTIETGLYFIDRNDCIDIEFVQNNKSNTIISNIHLYNMLITSKNKNNFIHFPDNDSGFFIEEHGIKGLVPSDVLKNNNDASAIYDKL